MVFDAAGTEVSRRQLEHAQILPSPAGSSTIRSRSPRASTRSSRALSGPPA
jgi:hypothetical protein